MKTNPTVQPNQTGEMDEHCLCDVAGNQLCPLHKTSCIECGQELPEKMRGFLVAQPDPPSPTMPDVTVGSGNIFIDLGFPEAEAIELDTQARAYALAQQYIPPGTGEVQIRQFMPLLVEHLELRKSVLMEALRAVENERLEDHDRLIRFYTEPDQEEGDEAYSRAIDDAENAIRSLLSPEGSTKI